MREHSDFKNSTKLPNSTNTAPEFETVQETTSYLVFVLDISSSMNKGQRLVTLQKSVKYVIDELIANGSWLGIVSFSTDADVKKNITEVRTKSDRDELKNAIPIKAKGYTCIGCGLMEATNILKHHLGNATNSEIILVSDGENTPEYGDVDIDTARQAVIAENITVHTIAMSQQADTSLGDIAKETGGRCYTYLEKGNISFLSAFSQTISIAITSPTGRNVILLSGKLDSLNSTKQDFEFAIEEGLGKDTSFTFMTQKNENIHLKLYGPNNYTQVFKTHGNVATMSIPDIAQAGEYKMSVTIDTVSQSVEYYAKSKPTSDDIIKVITSLSTNVMDFSTGELPIIFADVTKGYLPVLNATVYARVETGALPCDVDLKDNGIDPDVRADDGIYSGYIMSHCLQSGRVNVRVHVKGKNGETMIRKEMTGATSQYEVDSQPEIYNSSFQREEVLEQLYVANYTDPGTSDVTSPGRISDVSLYHIRKGSSSNGERRNFTISWTATGDDKNIGQASSYIFRISNDIDVLLHDFDSAELLDLGNVSVIPQDAGNTEALKLIVDAEQAYTETLFFAVQTVDEAGNKGEVSNIISIVVAKNYSVCGEKGTLVVDDDEDDSDTVKSISAYHSEMVFHLLPFFAVLVCKMLLG